MALLTGLGFGLYLWVDQIPDIPWWYSLMAGLVAFSGAFMCGSVAFWFLLLLTLGGKVRAYSFLSALTGLVFVACCFFTAYYRIWSYPLGGLSSLFVLYVPALVSTYAFWRYSQIYIHEV